MPYILFSPIEVFIACFVSEKNKKKLLATCNFLQRVIAA
jgi:hypothetical protein